MVEADWLPLRAPFRFLPTIAGRITGVVTDRREAVIRLKVHGPAGQDQEIEAIIDTGFDVWLPELAPSAPLVSYALSVPFTPERWATYARKYRGEMRKPAAQRLLALLAALSSQTNFSVGC